MIKPVTGRAVHRRRCWRWHQRRQQQRHTTDRAWLHRLITKWANKNRTVDAIGCIIYLRFMRSVPQHSVCIPKKIKHITQQLLTKAVRHITTYRIYLNGGTPAVSGRKKFFSNLTFVDSYILSHAINIWYENIWVTKMAWNVGTIRAHDPSCIHVQHE